MKITSAAVARVGERLLTLGACTAADLAHELELTGTAVRRHLDQLLAAGFVQALDRAPFGPAARVGVRGRGRPARVYLLTDAGRAAFANAQESLALAAVRHIASAEGSAGLQSFARVLTADFVERHRAEISAASDRGAALAAALTADGFAAATEPSRPGFTQLCQHNCPVGDVAAEFPVFCDAELAAFSELTGVHVTRLATLAKGDAICTTLVPAQGRESA